MKLKLNREKRAFSNLDELRDRYFTWWKWVLGGGLVHDPGLGGPFDVVTGCLEWFGRQTEQNPLAGGLQLPFRLTVSLDRLMKVRQFEPFCFAPTTPFVPGGLLRLPGVLLPGGTVKPAVGKGKYELDVTTESRAAGTQTRYRLVIDGCDYTGKVEMKIIGGRVCRRGRVDGCLTLGGRRIRAVAACARVPITVAVDEFMAALYAAGARATGPADWPADLADEQEWEGLARRLAVEFGVPTNGLRAGENISRLDELEAAAKEAGLGGKLLSYPHSAQTIPLKKALMRARLQFNQLHQRLRLQLVGSMGGGGGGDGAPAGLPFARLLARLNDLSRLSNNLRSRQIGDSLSSLQDLSSGPGTAVTFAGFNETVRKAMSITPPSRLLALTEYERCGGTEAVFEEYYGSTVPGLISPVMERVDVHVQHDELWQVTAVDYRDRQDKLGVLCVTWSTDGDVVASGNADSCARLWSAEGAVVRTLRGHLGPVVAVAFAGDRSQLLTGSTDGTVRLWQLRFASAHVDARVVVSAVGGGPEPVRALPSVVVLGHPQPDDVVWATLRGQSVATAGPAAVSAVAAAPAGHRFASACGDAVLLWASIRAAAPESHPPTSSNWHLLGQAAREAALQLGLNQDVWDDVHTNPATRAADVFGRAEGEGEAGRAAAELLTGCTKQLASGHGDITCLGWGCGGELLAAGCRHKQGDGKVILWAVSQAAASVGRLQAPPPVVAIIGHPGPVKSLGWAGDDRMALATATSDALFIWRCEPGGCWAGTSKWEASDVDGAVRGLAWLPEERSAAARPWEYLGLKHRAAAALLGVDEARWRRMRPQERVEWLERWGESLDELDVPNELQVDGAVDAERVDALSAAEDAVELLLAGGTHAGGAVPDGPRGGARGGPRGPTRPIVAVAVGSRVLLLAEEFAEEAVSRSMVVAGQLELHSAVAGVCAAPAATRLVHADGAAEIRFGISVACDTRVVMCQGVTV